VTVPLAIIVGMGASAAVAVVKDLGMIPWAVSTLVLGWTYAVGLHLIVGPTGRRKGES
jgi:hypothetical protein